MAASQMQESLVDAQSSTHRQIPPRSRLLSRSRWGVNQMTTLRWSLEEDLRNYRKSGITRIGLSRPKVAEFGDEQTAALLREHNLQPSSLSWAGGFTGSNGFDYRESVEDAREALRTAQILGSPVLVVVTGGQGAFTPRHVRGLVIDTLRQLGDRAATSGLRLALQPMHRRFARKTSLVATLADSIELLEQVNHPAVGLALDLFALGGGEGFVSQLPSVVRHCSLVTLSDAPLQPAGEYDRVPLGQGVLPIKSSILALEHWGYRGHYEFQSLSEQTWGRDYSEVLQEAVSWFDQEIRAEDLLPLSALPRGEQAKTRD